MGSTGDCKLVGARSTLQQQLLAHQRFFAFVRRIAGRSACVERWGGILKRLYSPQVGQTTTSLVQAARLSACGLRANGSDDAIIHQIASSLWGLTKHRNTNNRALLNFKAKAVREAAGKLGADLHTDIIKDVLAKKITSKRAREMVTVGRLRWEPKSLEVADKTLLDVWRKRGALSLPLLATNHKQWLRERDLTDRDISRTQRAIDYSVLGVSTVKHPRELGDSSSDPDSVDTDQHSDASSATESSADDLWKPEAGDSRVAGRFDMDEESRRTFQSGDVTASGSASSSASPTIGAAQFKTLSNDFDCLSWAIARGGKIHLRLDAAETSHPLCNSSFALSPDGLLWGDTVASLQPHEGKHDWCKRCVKHRGT
jgi:hypothetical protein